MTIDGEPFNLHLKSDALQPIDWLTEYQHQSEASPDTGAFKETEDNIRIKALENERSKYQTKSYYNPNKNAKAWNNKKIKRAPRRNIVELQGSIGIPPDVTFHAEIPFTELSKAFSRGLPKVSDMCLAGLPPIYNAGIERATCANAVKLDESTDPSFYERSETVRDPMLLSLLKELGGTNIPTLVATDETLALVMATATSVNPWHLSVTRMKNFYILSKKRKVGNVEPQWVSETAMKDIIPSEDDPCVSERISSLGEESTKAHEAFIRAGCSRSRAKMTTQKNPFPRTQPRLYRYRLFTMHPNTPETYQVLVRCEIDAVTPTNDYVRMFGLLEQSLPDRPSEWRKGLDTNKASYLPMSFGANKCKVTRWIASAYLSGARYMKIGFLAREQMLKTLSTTRHEILGVQSDQPVSLANQLSTRLEHLWGVVDTIMNHLFAVNMGGGEVAMIIKPSAAHHLLITEDIEEDADNQSEDEEEEEEEEEEEDD